MVTIQLEYEGDLHSKAVHGPSGTELNTDAPTDNQGRGESFSPTDLTATSLGSCILTTMGILARRLNLDMAGATAVVEKEMTSEGPRKIRRLTVRVKMPKALSADDQLKLERAAQTCPVARSLHPDVEQVVEFSWG